MTDDIRTTWGPIERRLAAKLSYPGAWETYLEQLEGETPAIPDPRPYPGAWAYARVCAEVPGADYYLVQIASPIFEPLPHITERDMTVHVSEQAGPEPGPNGVPHSE